MQANHVRTQSMPISRSRYLPSNFVPTSTYPHVAISRSSYMELQIYSPSAKLMDQGRQHGTRLLPVFADNDQVVGKVVLSPNYSAYGRLLISLEGALLYPSPKRETDEPDFVYEEQRRHVFFSSSTAIAVGGDAGASYSSFGEAFATSPRQESSSSSMNMNPHSAERSYSFSFDLSCRDGSGEKIPPSFPSKLTGPASGGGKSTETFEVAYKIIVSWEASYGSNNQSILEAPIFMVSHRSTEVQALDGDIDAWLEMPLRSERPISFRCAVTLPTPLIFSSGIPYFVVFTTTPRSPSLAQEITSDATISLSLIRQITINDSSNPLPTPPYTPSPSRENLYFSRMDALRHPVKARPIHDFDSADLNNKPLPRLPEAIFSSSHILQTSICIGFPKRPRRQCESGSHPSLDSHNSLPDGLHKAKIPLNNEMLPSVDCAGMSIKYFLDVSVVFGQDDLRAHIPIQIV